MLSLVRRTEQEEMIVVTLGVPAVMGEVWSFSTMGALSLRKWLVYPESMIGRSYVLKLVLRCRLLICGENVI